MYDNYLIKKGKTYKLTKDFYDLSLKEKLKIITVWINEEKIYDNVSESESTLYNRVILSLMQHNTNYLKNNYSVKGERQLSAAARKADNEEISINEISE